jgi:rod shape-determining protein MreD
MNDTYELRSGDTHIEVHKFFPGAVAGVAIVTLILQASFPVYIPKLDILDLPLLITIYFGLSRRNPSTGLIIGFLASSIGARLDTEHPAARFSLTVAFFVLHQAILVLTRRVLMAQPEPWFNMHLAIAAAVNAVLGTFLYIALDRLRRNS